MYTPLQVSIPEPCHEDWHRMTPVEYDQRHCQACDRVLTDFTQMTDKQVGSFLRRHEGRLCGRWRADQLNRPLATGGPRRTSGWRAAAVAAGLTLALPLMGQETATRKTVLITGVVRDAYGEEGLIGASVQISGSETGTITDVNGAFQLRVPAGQETSLLVRYTGFSELEKTITAPSSDTSQSITLNLEIYEDLVGEVVIIRRSLLHRMFVQPVRRYLIQPVRNLLMVNEDKRAARKAARAERRATAPSTSPAPASAPKKTAGAPADALQLTATPNPVSDHIRISFQLPAAGVYHLELFSAEGRLVAERRGRGEAGEQDLVMDQGVTGLPAGSYALHLRTDTGERATIMIVKQ